MVYFEPNICWRNDKFQKKIEIVPNWLQMEAETTGPSTTQEDSPETFVH